MTLTDTPVGLALLVAGGVLLLFARVPARAALGLLIATSGLALDVGRAGAPLVGSWFFWIGGAAVGLTLVASVLLGLNRDDLGVRRLTFQGAVHAVAVLVLASSVLGFIEALHLRPASAAAVVDLNPDAAVWAHRPIWLAGMGLVLSTVTISAVLAARRRG